MKIKRRDLSLAFNIFKSHFSFKKASYLPYKINFDVTYGCNSKCKTCSIWKYPFTNKELLKNELGLQEYSKIFDHIGDQLLIASFEGGEPFLKRELSTIIGFAYKKCPKLNRVLIATNGSLTDTIVSQIQDVRKLCPNLAINIAYSVEGEESVHDDLRGIPRGFEKIMATFTEIEKLKDTGIFQFYQTTINTKNWKTLIEWYKYQKIDVVFTLAQSAKLFNEPNPDSLIENSDEKSAFLEMLTHLGREYRINSPVQYLNHTYLKLIPKFIEARKSPISCYAGKATLSIDPQGNVYACAFMQDKMGNLRDYDYDLHKIYMNNFANVIRNKVEKLECPNCWMNCDGIPSIIHNRLSMLS